MRGLLAALGDPQLRFPAVLVAGSNGKGSTAALLAAMAAAAGYRTGLYTSPHLEDVEERLRLNGRAVDGARLGELLAAVVSCAEGRVGHTPTYFEALTAAAFLWFAAEEVDLAVVEVGMGGRLDATNLCEPVLSLITSISLEHREMLGDTLAQIAREKAGILRPGRPALSWVEDPEAAGALRQAAAGLGTELHAAEREVTIVAREARGWEGQTVTLVTPAGRRTLPLRLLGRHQAHNLGLATRAAELLAGMGFPALGASGSEGSEGAGDAGPFAASATPEALSGGAIAAGAAACRWPGRVEVVSLPGGRRALLDAAHNGEGTAALAEFLDEARDRAGTVDLVFGALGDKDAGEMLGHLAPRARRLVLTTAPSPRARPAAELAALLAGSGRIAADPAGAGRAAPLLVEAQPAVALALALELGAETVVVCGSIFLVGELRRQLRERFGVPAPASDLV
jgi:dihydrofolate synthase/folylpolyglutamate synthase